MNNQSLEERASHLVTQPTKEEISKYSRREVLEYLGKVAIYAAELGGLAYFLSACKGGSRDGGSSPTGPTQPTGGSSPPPESLNLVRLWPWNDVTYRVEGANPQLQALTNEAANWWNSKLDGVVKLVDSGGNEPNIYMQLGVLRPGECGRTGHTSRFPPSGLDIVIDPKCGLNIFTIAHEFGHGFGINNHTCRGVMSGRSDCPTRQPIATALNDTEPWLFEAIKSAYRN